MEQSIHLYQYMIWMSEQEVIVSIHSLLQTINYLQYFLELLEDYLQSPAAGAQVLKPRNKALP